MEGHGSITISGQIPNVSKTLLMCGYSRSEVEVIFILCPQLYQVEMSNAQIKKNCCFRSFMKGFVRCFGCCPCCKNLAKKYKAESTTVVSSNLTRSTTGAVSTISGSEGTQATSNVNYRLTSLKYNTTFSYFNTYQSDPALNCTQSYWNNHTYANVSYTDAIMAEWSGHKLKI